MLRITESILINISELNLKLLLKMAYRQHIAVLSRIHDMPSCTVSGLCWYFCETVWVKIPFMRITFSLLSSLCYRLLTVQEIMLWTLRGTKKTNRTNNKRKKKQKNNWDKIWITILRAFLGVLQLWEKLCVSLANF